MKRLGDELREQADKRAAAAAESNRQAEAQRLARAQKSGREMAAPIIASLPEKLRAVRGDRSFQVNMGNGGMRVFTETEKQAAYVIIEWARGQGLKAEIAHHSPSGDDFYPANDKLWISW